MLYFGYFISYKMIDRGIIEMLGPFGLSKTVLAKSNLLTRLQSGVVYDYSLWMFVGLIVLLLVFEFWDLFTILVDPSLILVLAITTIFAIV